MTNTAGGVTYTTGLLGLHRFRVNPCAKSKEVTPGSRRCGGGGGEIPPHRPQGGGSLYVEYTAGRTGGRVTDTTGA